MSRTELEAEMKPCEWCDREMVMAKLEEKTINLHITCTNGWYGMYSLTEDQAQRVMDYAFRLIDEQPDTEGTSA